VSVKDLMHSGTDIPKASPDMILKDAVVKMSQFGFGALIVCNEENDLLGIFTDGDLRRYFEKAENAELSIPLNKIMTANPKHTTPDRLAMEALKTMEDKSITSLPVAESGKVIGFLDLHDILRSRLV